MMIALGRRFTARVGMTRMEKVLEVLRSAVPIARDGTHATSSGWLPEEEARAIVRLALCDDPDFRGLDPWETFEQHQRELVDKRVILTAGRIGP